MAVCVWCVCVTCARPDKTIEVKTVQSIMQDLFYIRTSNCRNCFNGVVI